MKNKHLLLIFFCYIVAFTAGYLVFKYCNINLTCSIIDVNLLIRLFLFDVVATIIIYIFGVIFKNSSVYDPYWSLTPLIMLIFIIFNYRLFSIKNLLFIIVFSYWSIRLTINWMYTFKDLSTQDWRYQMYQDNHPKLWQLINFFGINMFPTILVFLGLIPAILFLFEESFNMFSIIGLVIMFLATTLELISDHQVHNFIINQKYSNKRSVCNIGLWKYSRHPNYLGEVSFWYGVYLVLLPVRFDLWFLIIGALLINLLFELISIPMMEKRQKSRRVDYNDYCTKVSRLLILPNRNIRRENSYD